MRIGRTRIFFWHMWDLRAYRSIEFGWSFLRNGNGFCVGLQWPIVQRLRTR